MIAKKLILSQILAAITDGGFDVLVHHQVVPQAKSFPAIIYKQISTNTNYCKGGEGIKERRMQIDVFHHNDVEAANIAAAIHKKVSLFIGDFEGVNFQYTTRANENETYDHEQNLHRITTDYLVRHS